MTSNLDIINEVCGDLGQGNDSIRDAYKACLDEFHKQWKSDGTVYRKVCRVFLIPSESRYHYDSAQGFWGRNSEYSIDFSMDSVDCRYLAPLGLKPQIWPEPQSAVVVNNNYNTEMFAAICKAKGVSHPQFLDFTDLIINGVELEFIIGHMEVENETREIASEFRSSVAELLYGHESWIGKYAKTPQIKDLIPFLSWVFWGLNIKRSLNAAEQTLAVENSICPPIRAQCVARARLIQQYTVSIFGHGGGNLRGKTEEEKLAMVAKWDSVLTSIGVEPPFRSSKMPGYYIKKEGE
jgi:hypothetical protein